MAQIVKKEEEMSLALAVRLKDAMAKETSKRSEMKEMQVLSLHVLNFIELSAGHDMIRRLLRITLLKEVR